MLTKHKGFTLIELLIVIIILSIISSVAVISLRTNENKQYETIANQFTNIFKLAEEEAMLRSTTLGLAFSKNSYQFYEYKESKKSWIKLNDPLLGPHPIPNNVQITLQIYDKTIEQNGKPQIIISASSDVTPFTILIGKQEAEAHYQVTATANGEVKSGYISQN